MVIFGRPVFIYSAVRIRPYGIDSYIRCVSAPLLVLVGEIRVTPLLERSIMMALSEIQRDWIESSKRGETTEVLFGDLSAAIDTLNTKFIIKIKKLNNL